MLEEPDYKLLKALKSGMQNFVITDPRLPDNPIVYASQGFLDITGYTLEQVLGRNCRFIQGPDTDVNEVAKVRKAIKEGVEVSVCLLNYKIDGSSFWNQVHIAPLRNHHGEIVNFVGVQCEVPPDLAAQHSKAATNNGGGGATDGAASSGAASVSGKSSGGESSVATSAAASEDGGSESGDLRSESGLGDFADTSLLDAPTNAKNTSSGGGGDGDKSG